jgi:hypothetical protein
MLHDLFVFAVIVIGIALLPMALAIVSYALVGLAWLVGLVFTVLVALCVGVMAFVLVKPSGHYPLFGLVVLLVAGAITAYKYPRVYRRWAGPTLDRIRAGWHRSPASVAGSVPALNPADRRDDTTEAPPGLSMYTVGIGDLVHLAGSPTTRGRVIAKRRHAVLVKWNHRPDMEPGAITSHLPEELRYPR